MKRQNSSILLPIIVFLIVIPLMLGQACDPQFPTQIENKTDMVLDIYVQNNEVGKVEPKNNIKVRNFGAIGYYSIEARNSKGEVIYSRKFSFTELNTANWKIVISDNSTS